MEFKSQICTTKEQSERLLALGLKKETADMAYEYKPKHLADTDIDKDWVIVAHSPCGTDIPAWSLHRLIEMIPTTVPDKSYIMHQLMVDGASISYYYFGEEESWEIWRIWNDKELYDNVIDCIKWLIGEGHFDKEYLEE